MLMPDALSRSDGGQTPIFSNTTSNIYAVVECQKTATCGLQIAMALR